MASVNSQFRNLTELEHECSKQHSPITLAPSRVLGSGYFTSGQRPGGNNRIAWIYLTVAGLLEIGWPLGLKIAENPQRRMRGIVMAVVFMSASGALLSGFRVADRDWHHRPEICPRVAMKSFGLPVFRSGG